MDQYGNPTTTEEFIEMKGIDPRHFPWLSPIESMQAYGSYTAGAYLRNFEKSARRSEKELEYRTNYQHLMRVAKWLRNLKSTRKQR
jgi:hypothetical protein